ncbi:ribbon-helix-helix domain-containing protein [Thiolapillus sp.]|uniref:ribbon-helix-helix domain-containing protein n=1 Tax=Thiolapillus sp. TaxID=2017437 RepID=UPI003AF528BB
MAIQKKPKTQDKTDAFMSGAPDAGAATDKAAPYGKGITKGKKRQVSITIAGDLLRQVDEQAEAMGTGRSAFISMALYKALKEYY